MSSITRIRFNCLLLLLSVMTLLLVGKQMLQRNLKSSKRQVTAFLTESQAAQGKDGYCNSEKLPEGLTKIYNMYDEVKTFLILIGCSRNTDKLTGAMLDAHPEILLSQKYDIIGNWKMFQEPRLQELAKQKYMLFYHLHHLSSYQALFRHTTTTSRKFWLWTFKGSGVNYNLVPGAWQGTIRGKIKVIGDSSGLVTSTKLLTNKGNFSVLREVEAVVKIPLKFIHVITNPFDDIASIVTKQSQQGKKVNDSNAFNQAMNHIFALLDINDKLRQIYGERVLDVFIYDSVPKQRETLRKICTFLEIYCDDSFSLGIETLFGDDITSRPRDQVEWRDEDKDLIENYMKKFDFLQPFSFDSSY
ncbi:uncharacterized protein LOC114964277 isoform X2 [Acropora millepora]|uniref:uncharacterized protein LOC114964277 isoform X2 n=1 Tax=Acropora millepora TaxID=45264 RepID=UPI001CF17894|nr:uncharacterized protein LOC114964277 isoform X2 [Acropora millepora]